MSETFLIAMLYVPGSDPRKLAKLESTPADAFILDLEDAVALSKKETARTHVRNVIEFVGNRRAIWVRINRWGTLLSRDDLAAVVAPGLSGIVAPKIESAAEVDDLAAAVASLEAARGMAEGSVQLIATIESVRGVAAAREIAAAGRGRLHSLGFGVGDFTLDLGIETDPTSPTVIAAKSEVVIASRLAGINPPHDSAFMDYQDLEALEENTRLGKRLGFFGKHAIHPGQVSVIRKVFTPSLREVARARRVIEEFEEAECSGRASIGVEGMLVDYPVADRARQIIRLAEAMGASTDE